MAVAPLNDKGGLNRDGITFRLWWGEIPLFKQAIKKEDNVSYLWHTTTVTVARGGAVGIGTALLAGR